MFVPCADDHVADGILDALRRGLCSRPTVPAFRQGCARAADWGKVSSIGFERFGEEGKGGCCKRTVVSGDYCRQLSGHFMARRGFRCGLGVGPFGMIPSVRAGEGTRDSGLGRVMRCRLGGRTLADSEEKRTWPCISHLGFQTSGASRS